MILILGHKKRKNCKVFHLSAKLIAGNSGIDEAFKWMHQTVITRTKNYACGDWIVLEVIIKHSIKIFDC